MLLALPSSVLQWLFVLEGFPSVVMGVVVYFVQLQSQLKTLAIILLSVLQWLFVLEGFPSVVMGVVVYFVLPDSHKTAPWLSDKEKEMLAADVSKPQLQCDRSTHVTTTSMPRYGFAEGAAGCRRKQLAMLQQLNTVVQLLAILSFCLLYADGGACEEQPLVSCGCLAAEQINHFCLRCLLCPWLI
jgi:hypothetical protein